MIQLDAQLQSRMAMLARILVHHPERAEKLVPLYTLPSDPDDYKIILGKLEDVAKRTSVTWEQIQAWVRSDDPHQSYAGKILRWAFLKGGKALPTVKVLGVETTIA